MTVLLLPDHQALVALGGNVGDVAPTMLAAIDAIDALPRTRVVARSRLYDTEPVGPPQDRYRNAAVRLETTLAPLELLEALLAIERTFGRERSRETRWGPRTLDLDLIAFGRVTCDDERLVLPHPRAWSRAFVLAPLRDIVPEAADVLADALESLGDVPATVEWPAATPGVRDSGP